MHSPSPGYAPVQTPQRASVLPGGWQTVVWNDPVNLKTYVVWVFQSYFSYPRGRAQRLMEEVHNNGRAVVSVGSREAMEQDVQALSGYGLWATLEQESN